MVTVKLEIPYDQGVALAQMCKRLCYAEMCEVVSGPAEFKSLEAGLWVLRMSLEAAGMEVH